MKYSIKHFLLPPFLSYFVRSLFIHGFAIILVIFLIKYQYFVHELLYNFVDII